MNSVTSKSFIGILVLLVIAGFASYFSGAIGDTTLGVTLKTNPELNDGLVAHYTFDGEFEQGTYEFGTGGATTTNFTGSQNDLPRDSVSHGDYIYIVGSHQTNGGGAGNYLTMKMEPITGNVLWSTSTDLGGGNDRAYGVAAHDDFLFVTGRCVGCGSLGGDAFFTMKVSQDDGGALWSTTTDLTSNDDEGFGVTALNGDAYVTGTCDGCGALGGNAFFTMGLDGDTGATLWSTTTDPTSSSDSADEITTDGTNLYMIGNCQSCDDGGFEWWIMSMDPANGGANWSTTTHHSSGSDSPEDILFWDDFLYITGQCDPGSSCPSGATDSFMTAKYSATDGLLIWATSTSPSTGNDSGQNIVRDRTHLYVVGQADVPNSFYTMKVDPSDGAMVWGTTTDPSASSDYGRTLVEHDDRIYILGACTGCDGSAQEHLYTFQVDVDTGDFGATSTSIDSVQRVGGAKQTLGNIGQGVSFDGVDDYVEIEDNAALKTGSNITVAAWVKWDVIDAQYRPFFVKRESSTIRMDMGIVTNRLYLTYTSSNVTRSGCEVVSPLEYGIAAGKWVHVVFAGDSAGCRGYINGELVISDTVVGDFDVDGNLEIGARLQQSPPNHMQGSVDDVRVYDRGLSSEEIERLYQLGATTKLNKTIDTNDELKDGLLAHFTFDGNSVDFSSTSGAILDVTGNGYNGSQVNLDVGALVPGNTGQGISIAGVGSNERIEIESDLSVDIGTENTISAWFNTNLASGSLEDAEVIGWAFGTTDRLLLGVDSNATGFFRMLDDINNRGASTVGTTPIENNTWYHMVFTCDSRGKFVFIDAQLELHDPDATCLNEVSEHNPIIGRQVSDSNEWDGELDDIRVYNRALATTSIERLYQLGATTKINKTINTNPDLENGLVGHWTFDGAENYSTFTDISGNDFHAHLQNETATGTVLSSGRIGQGLDLDGVDDFARTVSFDAATEIATGSVAFWAITEFDEGNRTGGENAYPLGAGSGGSTYFSVRHQGGSPSRWILYTSDTGRTIYNTPNDVVGWHHYSFTWDYLGAYMYIDGVEVQSYSGNALNTLATDELILGAQYHSVTPTDKFEGKLDDIRLYNRVLSQDEITRLYELGN